MLNLIQLYSKKFISHNILGTGSPEVSWQPLAGHKGEQTQVSSSECLYEIGEWIHNKPWALGERALYLEPER